MGAACCLGTMCCNCICSFCGSSRKVYSRIGYVLFSVLWVLISLILLHYGAKYFPVLRYFVSCPGTENYDTCLGISIVYRVSFALALFHLILFLLCLCKNELTSAINEGAWPAKFLFVFLLLLFTYFVPNKFFLMYGGVATVASFLFILYEMVLLVDLAHTWNKAWTDQYSVTSSQSWEVLLIVATVLLYGTGLVVLVWLVLSNPGWWKTLEIVSTVICAALFTGVAMSGWVEDGSLLTCGVMFILNVLMCGSLVTATPSSETWIGLALMLIALTYVSSTTAEGKGGEGMVQGLTEQVMEKKDEYERTDGNSEYMPEITMATALYHLLMLFASMYYAMLLTNWGAFTIKVNGEYSPSGLGLGTKLAAQWIANGMFIWTLIAPRMCPDRDFSV